MPISDTENETESTQDIEDIIIQIIHDVIIYSNMDYKTVLELPFDLFYLMRKNYIINELEKTEGGREYLEKCKRLRVTELDRKGLQKLKEAIEAG